VLLDATFHVRLDSPRLGRHFTYVNEVVETSGSDAPMDRGGGERDDRRSGSSRTRR
jgi:hypothetical protein